jgi:hypothetical protein
LDRGRRAWFVAIGRVRLLAVARARLHLLRALADPSRSLTHDMRLLNHPCRPAA